MAISDRNYGPLMDALEAKIAERGLSTPSGDFTLLRNRLEMVYVLGRYEQHLGGPRRDFSSRFLVNMQFSPWFSAIRAHAANWKLKTVKGFLPAIEEHSIQEIRKFLEFYNQVIEEDARDLQSVCTSFPGTYLRGASLAIMLTSLHILDNSEAAPVAFLQPQVDSVWVKIKCPQRFLNTGFLESGEDNGFFVGDAVSRHCFEYDDYGGVEETMNAVLDYCIQAKEMLSILKNLGDHYANNTPKQRK